MYKTLCPYAIGVHPANLEEGIAAARVGGFQGLEFNPHEIADRVEQHGAEAVRALFDQAGIRPAGWGLTVEWRQAEDEWRRGLEELPRLARAAAGIGATRVATWVLPGSDVRTYEENYRFHLDRFRPISEILAAHGCSLGLEFIGPKTLRDTMRHPFIFKMEDMLALGREIGPNVGLLLDCWHWYTSCGTLNDLRALIPEQIVYVHVNDAPVGIPVDEQQDNVRALPGETGVIDIVGFLQALAEIDYTGPVTPEPFKRQLGDLPSDEARLKAVGRALDEVFTRAGLAPYYKDRGEQ